MDRRTFIALTGLAGLIATPAPSVKAAARVDCSTCKFFKAGKNRAGTCRRFPKFEPRANRDWCGEWKA